LATGARYNSVRRDFLLLFSKKEERKSATKKTPHRKAERFSKLKANFYLYPSIITMHSDGGKESDTAGSE